MKRILTVSILLVFILSITAVTAHDNTTQDSEILSDETPIKEDLNIEIDYPNEVVPKQYGSGPFLSFKNVPSNFDTNAKIYVDDNYRRDVAISDTTEFTVNQLSEGEHIITAQIPETLKYNSLNVTHKFKLTYSKISIPQEIYSGQYGSAFVSIPYDADGYVKVKVDGKDFKSVKVEETDSVSVPLSGLSLGKHVVEVTYTGGKYPKNYKKATVDCTFLISGISPEIIYGEQIHFFAPEDLTSKFKVIIDNKTYSTYHNGDYYTVNLTYLNPGTHTVKLIYPGDKKYPSKTITTNVTSKGEITYNLGTKKTNPEVYLKLPNDAKGKLNIFINGELFKSIPISNNIAYCNFTELRMGEYDLHATYTGDDYNIGNYTTPKTIPMEIKPIVIYPDSITYKQNAYLTFKVEKDINGSFLFGDEVVPIINGEGKFSLANMEIRQWNGFTITYENDTYRFRDDYSIIVNPIPAKITGLKDTTLYYGESKTLTVKVLGDYGTPVEREHVNFYIGSTLYQIETNMKGVVNFKIPNTLAPGTYKLKALYHGHGVSKKLTVKQVLTLKAATVKKSAKTLTLQATLKNTKPITGKQITFKFNGKAIGKTKTNSKGIAKITVKKSVLSKLKVGKKITYEATYLKNTVKKTATVKK